MSGGNRQHLIRRLRERFGPLLSVVPLAADASTRLFFRVGRLGGHSAVIMVDPAGGVPALARLRAAHRALSEAGLRLPAILDEDEALSAVVFEDLGDQLLATVAFERRATLYARAGRMAGLLDRAASRPIHGEHPLAFPRLDAERLRSELAFFVVHEVAGRRDLRDPALLREISRGLDRFITTLDLANPRLCHRDYHSRNLLCNGDDCTAVDFQDALLGPRFYDLASLIYDPYVELDPDQRQAAVRGWNQGCRDEATDLEDPRLMRVGVQRLLKAAGTFAYQATRLARPRFLDFLPPALGRARDLLAKLNDAESRELARVLGRACPEFLSTGGTS
ncbi:MAG: phosphotransferase [Acidobacteriota bacterium]|nr:phosphotransferase [Acidobacteriota bacterium]